MPSSDPFSGMHLSEQAVPAKIEQRLFTTAPPVPAAPKEKVVTKIEESKPTGEAKPALPKPNLILEPKPQKPSVSRYDLNDEPLYKASYVFTQEELEALEDLKLELRREYDTKVTKNDLIRSALHMLLEDHGSNGLRSYAARKIRGRRNIS